MISIITHNKLVGYPVCLSQHLVYVSFQRSSEMQASPSYTSNGDGGTRTIQLCARLITHTAELHPCAQQVDNSSAITLQLESGCGQGRYRGWESSLGLELLKIKHL